ncbi:hypothetical protein U1Q18_003493, partial [Sarracenia purpurea var. burkii]
LSPDSTDHQISTRRWFGWSNRDPGCRAGLTDLVAELGSLDHRLGSTRICWSSASMFGVLPLDHLSRGAQLLCLGFFRSATSLAKLDFSVIMPPNGSDAIA